MTFAEIIAATVPEKQEDVRKALAALEGAVKIGSREDAAKLLLDNPFVKAEFDANLSKKNADYEARYNAEKLPGIVDAKVAEELAKRAPKPTNPEVAAVLEAQQKTQKELDEWKARAQRTERAARVVPKLAELGLGDLADLVIAESDELTDKRLEALTGSAQKMRDTYAEKILRERYGNAAPPSTGTAPAPADLKAQHAKALADGNADLALALKSKMAAMTA